MALSHQFDDEVTSHNTDHLLTYSCRRCRTNIIIDIKPGTNNRGVAYSAPHLEGEPACCAGTGQIAVSIQGNDSYGIVIFYVDNRFVLCRLKPFFPGLLGGLDQKIFFLKSIGQGKLECALACEHDVWCLLHHHSCNGYRMLDMFEKGNGSAVAVFIHYA